MVMGVLSTLLLIKDTPEQVGLNIDGMSNEDVQKFWANLGSGTAAEISMTQGEALRTTQFWLFSLVYGISFALLGAIQGNITLMGVGYGLSPAVAGTAMSALMLPAIFSRVGIGLLGDKFGNKRMLILSTAVSSVIFFAGWVLVKGVISLYIFLVLQGFFMMAGMTLCPPLWGDLFGRRNLVSILGFGSAASIAVSGLSTLAVGYIRVATGTYNLVFLMLGILCIVEIIFLQVMGPTRVQRANTINKKA